ncbi:MAG: aminoglycoside phosphotransferase family protein [Francisellaceae bacterium]
MKTLTKNVIDVWGSKGRDWLDRLPEILIDLTYYWHLSELRPVDNMSYNYVAKAIRNGRKPVVIKISCDHELIENEYRALKHFDGKGSVRVLDINVELNALLLEQAISGCLLKTHLSKNIDKTIEIYGDIVEALRSSETPPIESSHVEIWCQAIDRVNDKRIDARYIEKAKALRDYLLSSSEDEYLCHGDLHLENILCHKNTWLSIDPKGIIAEAAFEVAAFDLIDKSEWINLDLILEKIVNRVNLLADVTDVDKDRLLGWIFLRVIISAQWFIEDNGDPGKMLKLADILYPLLVKPSSI